MDKSKIAGIAIFLMILFSIASAVTPLVSPLASAGFAWLAFFLLLQRLPRAMMVQVSAMVSIGLLALAVSKVSMDITLVTRLFSANHSLITVIAAVGFLRLVTQPAKVANEQLPVGRMAVTRTIWGLHLFSSVITLSAMMIFGGRIEKEAALSRIHAITFSRTFACGCFWSPFYVSIATALLYAPGSELLTLALAGVPVALFGLAFTSWEVTRDGEIENTPGYPVHIDALYVPLALSVLMIGTHMVFPEFPVLSLISIISLGLTAALLVTKEKNTSMGKLREYIVNELPRMNRELSLFLGAGIMSTGIMVFLGSNYVSVELPVFTPAVGAAFITIAIALSIVGVHPIITISAIGSLLTASDYSPNLLGLCMMMMWGLAIVVSPLSGVNLTIQGRFGFSGIAMMRWNAGYTLAMLLFCTVLLYFYSLAGLL